MKYIIHILNVTSNPVSKIYKTYKLEVYYINKAYSMDVHWGTATAWTVQDPSLQIPFEMQAHGQFAVKVTDSKQLLMRLVGTTTSFTTKALQDYFYGIIISRIKENISNLMISEGYTHAEVNTQLGAISEKVSPKLAEHFTKYGLALEDFVVENISIVKDEEYKVVREAMVTRAKNTITGVTEQEKMSYDVAKTQAANPGTGGQFGQVATGLAAGMAMAQPMANIARNVMQPINDANQGNVQHRDQFSMGVVNKRTGVNENTEIKCKQCGAALDINSRFCNQCGEPVADETESIVTCPVCGTKLTINSKFCNACGTKL